MHMGSSPEREYFINAVVVRLRDNILLFECLDHFKRNLVEHTKSLRQVDHITLMLLHSSTRLKNKFLHSSTLLMVINVYLLTKLTVCF